MSYDEKMCGCSTLSGHVVEHEVTVMKSAVSRCITSNIMAVDRKSMRRGESSDGYVRHRIHDNNRTVQSAAYLRCCTAHWDNSVRALSEGQAAVFDSLFDHWPTLTLFTTARIVHRRPSCFIVKSPPAQSTGGTKAYSHAARFIPRAQEE